MMLKEEQVDKNPLRRLFNDQQILLADGEFGAVLARAGVGKTAFIVQIALNSLLQHKNVLHVSLGEPVQKVSLWYEEVFRRIGEPYESTIIQNIWETILTHRFIMTFQAEDFGVSKLSERIADLTEQAIFHPQIILIDGMDFDDSPADILTELRPLAQQWGVGVWFTTLVHRSKETSSIGLPKPPNAIVDLFNTAVLLDPDDKNIHVRMLKSPRTESGQSGLSLDPATMLIRDQSVQ